MKKIVTDSKQLGVLRLLDDFARANGLSLSDQAVQTKLLDALSRKFREHQANPALLHGFRAQTMFAYVAAALGGCKIITEEESGDLYLASPDFKRPDYRILTHADQEFFVEVKNFHPPKPEDPFVLKSDYATKLENYARAFQTPLLIAV